MPKLNKITLCFDMAGCPNRCRHCWIGISDTLPMGVDNLLHITEEFKKRVSKVNIYSWYREPDYRADYQKLFELEQRLSVDKQEHFELASFWRVVRDKQYTSWLYDIGVRKCQLTLFGDETVTDWYVGRKGAYREIISAMDILLNHGIAPRIQLFVNQNNISSMKHVVELCRDMDIENRCQKINQKFELFVHAGSCDGENEKLYDIWVENKDIRLLPDYIVSKTFDYMQTSDIRDVFGHAEEEYCKESFSWEQYAFAVSDEPIFYINGNFDVFPNVTTPYAWWKIGNLLKDGYDEILDRYKNGRFFAVQMLHQMSFEKMLVCYGHSESKKLFLQEDYYYYIMNQYLRDKFSLIG